MDDGTIEAAQSNIETANISECLSIIKNMTSQNWSDPGVFIGIAGVIVAIAAVWYARRQLIASRENSIRERTLQICFAYDRDPIISEEVKLLREADEENDLSALSRHTKRTILNYFDVIAIGIHQNSYDFEIVFYQFRHIIPNIVRDILSEDDQVFYPDLMVLVSKITERDSSEKMAK